MQSGSGSPSGQAGQGKNFMERFVVGQGRAGQRTKPETMGRAAMMRRNKIYRVDAAIIVDDYKQNHPKAGRRGSGGQGLAVYTSGLGQAAHAA